MYYEMLESAHELALALWLVAQLDEIINCCSVLPLYVIVCIEQAALPQICYLLRFLFSWISCQHHMDTFFITLAK